MNTDSILKISALALQAIAAGADAAAVARRQHAALSVMVAEGRDPTDEELDAAFERVASLNEQIQDTAD